MPDTVDYGAADPNSFLTGFKDTNALMQGLATRQAGQLLAGGDEQGAENALLRSGAIGGAQQLQDRHIQQQKESTQFVLDAATAIQRVKDAGGDPVAAFDQLAPVFSQREGASPETLAMMRQQLQQNPDVFLQAVTAHAKQGLIKLAAGESIYDQDNKRLLYQSPQIEKVGPDETLVSVGGTGGPSAGAGAGTPATGGAAGIAAPAAPSGGVNPAGQGQLAGAPAGAAPPPPPGSASAPPVAGGPISPATLRRIQQNPAGYFGQFTGGAGDPTITSGYRSPERNAAVGGSKTSEHMQGTAWDMTPPPGMNNAQLIQALQASGTPFDQIIDEGNHVHFGIGGKMRGEVLRKTPNGYRRIGGAPAVGVPAPAPAPSADTGQQFGPGVTVLARGAPKSEPGFTLGQGQERFDAQGHVIARGLPPRAAGGGTGKLATQDAARLKAMDADLDHAETLANMSHQFVTRMGNFETGWQYQNIGGHNQQGMSVGGINPGQLFNQLLDPNARDTVQDLQSISQRMAPMLRPTGTGRILSSEYQNFIRAAPSVANSNIGNRKIDAEYQQGLAQMRAKSIFYHQWAHVHGNLDDADEAWYQHGSTAPQAAQPGVRNRTWTPEKGLQ